MITNLKFGFMNCSEGTLLYFIKRAIESKKGLRYVELYSKHSRDSPAISEALKSLRKDIIIKVEIKEDHEVMYTEADLLLREYNLERLMLDEELYAN